jgi:carboxylate-amine ligase
VVAALAEHCREALADAGDAGAVAELLADLLARGNGAAFQREEYRRSGHLSEMISRAVEITVS